MNRQERRKHQRETAISKRIEQQLYERQALLDDRLIEIYLVCVGLAVNEVLHDDNGDLIAPVINAFNRHILRFHDEGTTFETLAGELKEKTGIEFKLK